MDEQLRIIKMVEEGKLNAEQAAALLKALKPTPDTIRKPRSQEETIRENTGDVRGNSSSSYNHYDKKMFHIQIKAAGLQALNLQFPVSGIRSLLKATGKIPILCEDMNGINLKDITGLDLKEIIDLIIKRMDDESTGDFINITSPDGSCVRIFVE